MSSKLISVPNFEPYASIEIKVSDWSVGIPNKYFKLSKSSTCDQYFYHPERKKEEKPKYKSKLEKEYLERI